MGSQKGRSPGGGRSRPGRWLSRNESVRFYLFIYLFIFILLCFLLLFSYSCPYFPPLLFHALPTTHLPLSILPHIVFVHGSYIHVPCLTLLPFPCYPPSPSLLVTVSLFFISMSLVIFCLFVCFVDQVPLIGEIIWYLSFTAQLISLSIILYSSIYAVAKGRSSFFVLRSITLCKCTSFFIHSFTDGHLGCFQHLAIVN